MNSREFKQVKADLELYVSIETIRLALRRGGVSQSVLDDLIAEAEERGCQWGLDAAADMVGRDPAEVCRTARERKETR